MVGSKFNTIPNDKFFDCSKLKAFADNKINVTKKQKLFFGWSENIVGKGENAAYQHFLLFPQCFQKVSFLGSFGKVLNASQHLHWVSCCS